MIILLNSNLKGGVSKSVNNVMMTNELAERDYKVLFIDLDPQMSATRILTQMDYHDPLFQERNIYHVINNDDIDGNILQLREGIDYIPGSPYVNLFEKILTDKRIKTKNYFYFRTLLQNLSQPGNYDFLVMDMSPSKSFLNLAAKGSDPMRHNMDYDALSYNLTSKKGVLCDITIKHEHETIVDITFLRGEWR